MAQYTGYAGWSAQRLPAYPSEHDTPIGDTAAPPYKSKPSFSTKVMAKLNGQSPEERQAQIDAKDADVAATLREYRVRRQQSLSEQHPDGVPDHLHDSAGQRAPPSKQSGYFIPS